MDFSCRLTPFVAPIAPPIFYPASSSTSDADNAEDLDEELDPEFLEIERAVRILDTITGDKRKRTEDPSRSTKYIKLDSSDSEQVALEALATLKKTQKEISEHKVIATLKAFAEEFGNDKYQVVDVREEGHRSSRNIVHRTASDRIEIVNPKEVLEKEALNAGVTSVVFPVVDDVITSVKAPDKYVYRYAARSDGIYSTDYIKEFELLTDLDQANKKYVGLRQIPHCLVLHPQEGIGCLDKAYSKNLLEFLNTNTPENAALHSISVQLMLGLATLFKHSIIHTDLKLENVLVDVIDGKVIAYHADLGRAEVAQDLAMMQASRYNSRKIIKDNIQNISSKIDEAPFPYGNSVDVEIARSEELAEMIDESESFSELTALYKEFLELSQKRVLFSFGCMLYQMYTRAEVGTSEDPEALVTLSATRSQEFHQKLKDNHCPEIIHNLITKLLLPLNERISAQAFINEVNCIQFLSDDFIADRY